MIVDDWPAPVTGFSNRLAGLQDASVDGKTMLEIPNLLVTDDDSAFRRVVCEGLSRRGFRVTQARDGQEAIDVFSRSGPRGIARLSHARVSGLEVIRHLYDSPESPPCVLMSAELNDEIRREAERMRAYQVLSKPVRMSQLTTLSVPRWRRFTGGVPSRNSSGSE